MAARVARYGDKTDGRCRKGHYHEYGRIISGSLDVFINGKRAARYNDKVRANCHHLAKINSGALDVFINGLKMARVGDHFYGSYKGLITSGSLDVFYGA
jgi:uncharacterized Zn-binding protein involved in type VI secretion